MKRIGILTYHRSINYGAFMQAYSLSKRLKDELPNCTIEIIDYISEKVFLHYHESIPNYLKLFFKEKNLRGKASILRRSLLYVCRLSPNRKKINEFFESQLKYLPLSNVLIKTDNAQKLFDKIKGEYDILIVGSDAVWNWQIREFPTPYFLNSNIVPLKFSYAASSYGQDFSLLTESQIKYIRSSWEGFTYLGVRDEATEEFIKFIDPSLSVEHNCDPTVFLDMEKIPVDIVKLKQKLIDSGVSFDKPIIGLMGNDNLGFFVRQIVGDDTQIISLFKPNKFSNIFIEDLTPFEWSRIFYFFDITFTHYFHGNLLSLKNGTPTIVVEDPTTYHKKYNSKIRDFMSRIGLLNHCFYFDDNNAYQDIKELYRNMMYGKERFSKDIIIKLAKEGESIIGFINNLKSYIN